jgi:UDP-glucose 4-epimerase
VFNVGTGQETSVTELWERCRAVSGSSVDAVNEEARAGEIRQSVLDPSRTASELGFQAMVDIDEGLRATWDWISSSRKE